ncbi:hypothetical protein GCM10027613_39800 [Microlunatus endophyticus]
MPGRHPDQLPQGQLVRPRIDDRVGVFGEDVDDLVVQRQQPLGLGQTGGGRGEALGQRVKQVHVIRAVRPPPALTDDPVVPDDDQAVRLDAFGVLHRIEEGVDRGRVNALALRGGPFEGRNRRCLG